MQMKVLEVGSAYNFTEGKIAYDAGQDAAIAAANACDTDNAVSQVFGTDGVK
jgi:hypothetical protein